MRKSAAVAAASQYQQSGGRWTTHEALYSCDCNLFVRIAGFCDAACSASSLRYENYYYYHHQYHYSFTLVTCIIQGI